MSAWRPCFVRIGLVAAQTWREIARQHLLRWLAGLTAAAAAGALALADMNAGEVRTRFLLDAGLGAAGILGAILAVAATVQVWFADIERRSALMTLARPIARGEFVLGKLAGVLLVLLVFCLWVAALILALLVHGNAWRPGWGPLLLGALFLWLKLAVVAACTLFVSCSVRTPLLAAMTGLTVVVAGHLEHLTRDGFALAGSRWLAVGAWLVGTLVPDLQVFNAPDGIPRGEPMSIETVVIIAGYGLLYIGVYGALATASFARRAL